MKRYDALTIIPDLTKDIVPADGITSRTIYSDEQVKVVLFGFAEEQELSEHTAATPVTIQVIRGKAEIRLNEQVIEAHAGTWMHLPPREPHSVIAKTPMVLLLTLIKTPLAEDADA
jgi:quercetin dioxygenase-like cupin family protein